MRVYMQSDNNRREAAARPCPLAHPVNEQELSLWSKRGCLEGTVHTSSFARLSAVGDPVGEKKSAPVPCARGGGVDTALEFERPPASNSGSSSS